MTTVLRRWLQGSPLRTALGMSGVALGTALVLAVQICLAALDGQAAQAAASRAGASDLDVRATAAAGLDAAQVAALTHLHGVSSAAPLREKRVVVRVRPEAITALNATVMVLDGDAVALRPLRLVSGRLPAADSLDEVVLDEGLADALRSTGDGTPVRVGQFVRLTTETGPDRYRVAGISAGGSGAAGASFARSALYVTPAEAANTFSLGLRTPMVALRATPGTSPALVATEVAGALGGAALAVDPKSGSSAPLGDLRPLLALLTALTLVVAAAVAASAAGLAVRERARDIGLLRAAGASRRQVRRLVLAEAGAIATAGVLAGLPAGAVLARAVEGRLLDPGTALPPLFGGVRMALVAALVGSVTAVAGALLPAAAAAAMSPLAAVRGAEAPPSGVRRRRWAPAAGCIALAAGLSAVAVQGRTALAVSAALLLAGLALLAPSATSAALRMVTATLGRMSPSADLAATGLSRHRGRTALTVGALALAVATAVATAALVTASLRTGDAWVGSLFPGDAVMTSPATQPDAVRAEISHASGLRAAAPLRFFSVPLPAGSLGFAAVDAGVYARWGGLRVVSGDRSAALARLAGGPGVLLPSALASAGGWRVGDRLEVPAQSGTTALTVAGIVDHSFPAGDGRESVLIGDATARRLFGPETAGFDDLEVVMRSGASAEDLRAVAAAYGMQLVSVRSIQQSAADAIAGSVGLLAGISATMLALAMLAVVNTLIVTIRQGMRDIGLLRAVGLSRRGARRVLRWQAVLLALTGSLAGVAGGALLVLPLSRLLASPGFDLDVTVPWAAIGATVAAVVLCTGLTAVAPSRRIAGASIVAAVRRG